MYEVDENDRIGYTTTMITDFPPRLFAAPIYVRDTSFKLVAVILDTKDGAVFVCPLDMKGNWVPDYSDEEISNIRWLAEDALRIWNLTGHRYFKPFCYKRDDECVMPEFYFDNIPENERF